MAGGAAAPAPPSRASPEPVHPQAAMRSSPSPTLLVRHAPGASRWRQMRHNEPGTSRAWAPMGSRPLQRWGGGPVVAGVERGSKLNKRRRSTDAGCGAHGAGVVWHPHAWLPALPAHCTHAALPLGRAVCLQQFAARPARSAGVCERVGARAPLRVTRCDEHPSEPTILQADNEDDDDHRQQREERPPPAHAGGAGRPCHCRTEP